MWRGLSFVSFVLLLALAATVRGLPPENESSDPTAGATFVGEAACKKCHFQQHRTWKKMKHSSAWENLPEEYHDPAKTDEKGRQCISCHVTGWGEADRAGFESAEASAHLLGVQCEACHGPGSKHVEAGQRVLDEKRKEFTEGESTFIVLRTTNCSNCHNPHVSYKEKYGTK